MNPFQAMQRVRQMQKDGQRTQFQVTMAADRKARIQIYGIVGDWWDGLDAHSIGQQIAAVDADEIEVHLNSPGGFAYDGIAIYNALRQHAASVTIVVDALAASAASIIAMAGDTVIMCLGAQMMIHDASSVCWGTAAELRTEADVLDKLSDGGAEIYAAKAGGTSEEWRQVMLAETWYTAQEALAAKLADQVDTKAKADDPEQLFDLSVYLHAGRSNAPAPALVATQNPPAQPDNNTQKGAAGMEPDEFMTQVRQRAGVNEDATPEQVLEGLDEALAEQADPPATQTATVPAGMVLVDQATLTQLQADGQAGREARNQQVADRRTQLVDAAVLDGRILPSQHAAWVTRLEADPDGMEPVLAGLPKGLLALTETGYAPGADEVDGPANVRESAAYKNWSI